MQVTRFSDADKLKKKDNYFPEFCTQGATTRREKNHLSLVWSTTEKKAVVSLSSNVNVDSKHNRNAS